MQNTATNNTRRPQVWLAAAAVGGVVTVGGVTGVAIMSDDDTHPDTAQSTMELSLPDSGVMSSCIQYSVELLAQMPTAFSGEVLEADVDSVVLEVDRWYRGGDAALVELVNESGPMTSIDGVTFTPGNRYLVTGSEAGTVNSCGFTAEWSRQMADDYADAFGR